MANPKISTFIVGIIIASVIATIFGMVMAELSSNYTVVYTDNESIDMQDEFDEITNLTIEIENEATSDEDNEEGNFLTNTADFLGDLFNDGYKTLKITVKSFNIFRKMTDSGLQKVGLGETYALIRTAVVAIVIILLVIGVLISALVRKDV